MNVAALMGELDTIICLEKNKLNTVNYDQEYWPNFKNQSLESVRRNTLHRTARLASNDRSSF